ncbi:hypothetical protein M1137_02495 [Candidatus Parvarchaeota archaeon]|jgi:hypothetical protein|nr:hypothetical protein [Candidatus Parvarchaeota archaeon]
MLNKKNLADKMIKELLVIHDDTKEFLDVDSTVIQSYLKYQKYSQQEIQNLHFKLLLSHINTIIGHIDETLNKFKLADIKKLKDNLPEARKAYQKFNNDTKPGTEQIKGAKTLYDTIRVSFDGIKEIFPNLISEEKEKFRNRYVPILATFSAIYVTVIMAFLKALEFKVIALIILVDLLYIGHYLLRRLYKIEF